MWVVKLGGSMAQDEALPRWLAMLSQVNDGQVVVVPGGGPFADVVRDTQARWDYSDSVAHGMALLAMEQYGLMLMGIGNGQANGQSNAKPFRLAGDEDAIRAGVASGAIPIWLPSRQIWSEPGIPMNWNTTSDSLSAWLAKRLDADYLALIKSASLRSGVCTVADAEQGALVDEHFSAFVRGGRFRIFCVGHQDHAVFGEALGGLSLPGMEILP